MTGLEEHVHAWCPHCKARRTSADIEQPLCSRCDTPLETDLNTSSPFGTYPPHNQRPVPTVDWREL